jgi:hypothetical protein
MADSDFSLSGILSTQKQSEFSPSGIVASQKQVEWIETQTKPNRCIFSMSARRIVIRPDHFCGWTASWIGIRNHKFFWLFNFWGFVYISIFLIFDGIQIVDELDDPSGLIPGYLAYGNNAGIVDSAFRLFTGMCNPTK